jgi:hypothetical protein
MGDHLDRQPGSVGRELPGWQVVEPDPVLEVADGVLDLGVAPVVGLEGEGLAVTVGNEGVLVIEDQQRELAARGGSDAADDEPDRDGVLLLREWGVRRLGDIGPTGDPDPPIDVKAGETVLMPPHLEPVRRSRRHSSAYRS